MIVGIYGPKQAIPDVYVWVAIETGSVFTTSSFEARKPLLLVVTEQW